MDDMGNKLLINFTCEEWTYLTLYLEDQLDNFQHVN